MSSTAMSSATTLWPPLSASAVLIARDDIDTDQIIPARFLTTTTRAGLGVHCFADWRYDAAGAPRADFPLNTTRHVPTPILVAGDNFGCGSSREHAPWALTDAGFRAIIAGSFADIFRSNAHKNGLLTIAIGESIRDAQSALRADPTTTVHIDLDAQTVSWGDAAATSFAIDAFSKRALIEGHDELGMLLASLPDIEAFERQREGIRT